MQCHEQIARSRAHKTFRSSARGTQDPRFAPLEMERNVQSLSNDRLHFETWKYVQDTGPTAVLKSGNLTPVVTSFAVILVDRALFFQKGPDPKDFHLKIVKSPHCETQFSTTGSRRTST